MNGRLIVLDGLDGSGKQTQATLLHERFRQVGEQTRLVSFPDYDQPSSALVREYLAGKYGGVDEISPFAASSFYAVDRYASYMQFWKKEYAAGYTILADRYTTSNLIHQMCKLPQAQWEEFKRWTEDYEYNKLGLPRPDMVIYLDMDPAVSRMLLSKRYGGDESKKDIHEANIAYMERCRACASYAIAHFGWVRVKCSDKKTPRPVEEISDELYQLTGIEKERQFYAGF